MAFLSEAAVEQAPLDQLRALDYSIEHEEDIVSESVVAHQWKNVLHRSSLGFRFLSAFQFGPSPKGVL